MSERRHSHFYFIQSSTTLSDSTGGSYACRESRRGRAIALQSARALFDDVGPSSIHSLPDTRALCRLRSAGPSVAQRQIVIGYFGPWPRTTARSITFANSRTLPGHSCATSMADCLLGITSKIFFGLRGERAAKNILPEQEYLPFVLAMGAAQSESR